MTEYIVTAKVEVSIMADSPSEAGVEALDYLQGRMSVQRVEIQDVREADGDAAYAGPDPCKICGIDQAVHFPLDGHVYI